MSATPAADAMLRDRGDVYDRWAPRLQHDPLLAAMAASMRSIFAKEDRHSRIVVGAYLDAVPVDALVAELAHRNGAVGELGEARIRATVTTVLELLTPELKR